MYCEGTSTEAVFTDLYKRYYAELHHMTLRYVTLVESEDICQSAFEKLWHQRKVFNEIQDMKAYLFQIARNGCLTQKRKEKLHEAFQRFHRAKEEQGACTENQLLYAELNRHFQQAVRDLPLRRRQTFVLQYFEDCSIKEIAQQLGIAESTVKNMLKLSKVHIQKCILETTEEKQSPLRRNRRDVNVKDLRRAV
jgi:RNA polymerase sigma-70 factor (ECF subfamily)